MSEQVFGIVLIFASGLGYGMMLGAMLVLRYVGSLGWEEKV